MVGAGGWAAGSHLPALAGLAGYEVTAVATTRQESADRVAADHGVPLAFAGAGPLVAHDEVDLVVVSVKAPEHAKVIRAALEAGKHVLSEWPLTVDPAEAAELAELASAAGVTHAVVTRDQDVSSDRTRHVLGWSPTRPSLLAYLRDGG